MPGSLLDNVEPIDPPADPQDPPVNPQDPPADPPTGDYTPPATQEELDQLVQTRLDEAQAAAREGVPETAEAYTIPDIEGVDAEVLNGSNVFQTMRAAAHSAGMNQEGFNQFVQQWADAEKAEVEAYRTEQMSLLGTDEAAVTTRLGTLSGTLQRLLPEAEAQALLGAAASADVVKALEKLVAKQPAPRTPSGPVQKDTWATIEKLMASDAYMGHEHQRDPEVVARVEKYFNEGGTRG